MDNAAGSDFDIRPHEGLRMNFDAGGDVGRRMNVSGRADAVAMRLPRWTEMSDDASEGRMNVADGDERPIDRLQAGRDDHGRSFTAGKLRGELRMIGQRDFARPRDGQRGRAVDLQIAAGEVAIDQPCDLGERQTHGAESFPANGSAATFGGMVIEEGPVKQERKKQL